MKKLTEKDLQNLFDNISGYYNLMNNFISLGTHKTIKTQCIKYLRIKPDYKILDLCCGTGDIIEIINSLHTNTEVHGLDFSKKMIEIAKKQNLNSNFVIGKTDKLPFKNNYFDIVTISFGLRNVHEKEKTLTEIYRVLKPDGLFMHLDFGEKNIFNKTFDFIVPAFGKFLVKDFCSYKYLIESKQKFPEPESLITYFKSFGFNFLIRKDFIFKSISMQILKKPLNMH